MRADRVLKLNDFIRRLGELKGPDEDSHSEADTILCDTCRLLAVTSQDKKRVEELLSAYDRLNKYYA